MKLIYSTAFFFFHCISARAQNTAITFYDSARTLAEQSKISNAYSMLDSAIATGYYEIGRMNVDAGLHNLHLDANWNVFKEKALQKSLAWEPVTKPGLKKEILDIHELDQRDRQYAMTNRNLSKEENARLLFLIKANEKITRDKVAGLLDKYGWLSTSEVGREANETLFLVIIHSDSLAMQEKYLPLLKKAYKKGKATGKHYAMLTDRIALLKQKPQIYGSQISYATGSPVVYNLYKPEAVDKRRKKMGMIPLRDYLKNWGIKWP